MSRFTKRITAMLLAGMLVIGSAPGSVLAASTDVDPSQTSEIAEEAFAEETSEVSAGAGETSEIAEEAYTEETSETSEAPAAPGESSEESYSGDASAEEAVQYYSVTLDANGGYFEKEWDDSTGDYAQQAEVVVKQIPVDGTVAAFPVFNDPDGQTMVFAGWSLERDGELVSQANEEYIPVDSCVLYAVWEIEDADENAKQEDTAQETDAAKESEDSETEEESEAAQGYEETEAVEEAEVAQEFKETAEDGNTAQEAGDTNEDTDEYTATETDNEQDDKLDREVIYSDGVEENKEEAETTNKNTNSSREDYNRDSNNNNSDNFTELQTKKEEKPSNVNEDSSEVIINEGEEEGIVTNRLFGAVSTPTDGNRYTVLLLDNSGSMAGKPLTTEKEAAKKFCSQMLAADGVNYISIVTYSSSVLSANNFNKEIDDLSNQINSMTASGGTNTNAAIKQAIVLLNQVPDSAIKNIVLLSDGLPQSGEKISSGRYNSSDNSNYAYGNAVYETAKSIDSDWNLYSLGFFHALSGNDLDFARRLMSDLSDDPSMYYEVTDVNDLEFMFGKVVEDITQSDLKKLYIDQHIDYINSSQYTNDIIPGFGQSLIQILLDVRNDSAVKSYNFCSDLSDALGYELDLTKEYELLLANLMVNDQTYNGIKDAFLTDLHSKIADIYGFVIQSVTIGDDISQAVSQKEAYEIFKSLIKADPLSEKYDVLYEKCSEIINNQISVSQAKDILNDMKLDIATDAVDVVFSSAAETIEYYCCAQAYLNTTDDFIKTLIILDYCADINGLAGNIEGVEPLAQVIELAELETAIEIFIDNMENYKYNNASAVAEYACGKIKSKTKGKIADKVTDLMFSQIPIFNAIPYLKTALNMGKTLVDITYNVDDRAMSANMIEKLYIITALMEEVSSMFERGLLADFDAGKEEDEVFRSAAVFDESVNIYKTALKLAADYGARYEKLLLENESEKILPSKKKMSWYSTAVSLASVEKLRVDNILCHHEGILYNHKSDIVLDSTRLKIFTIACPVAVEVKDESGTQVAYLADNICEVVDGYSPYFYIVQNANNDWIKVVTLPDDSRYTVSITGMGNGSMNAYLGKYDGTEINAVKEYSGILVNENSFGYFGDEDTNGFESLIFDGVEYDKDNEHKGYYILSTEAEDRAVINVNKDQFYCANGQTLTITARIQTPSAFIDGSRKYTGYLAMLQNWSWVQLGAWYIDGGTVVVDIPISLNNISTGNKTFTVSLFESDNFTTGASLYDCMFKVNVLPDHYELTFDPNGGNCATESKAITYGLAYGELPIPQRSGYTFGGWFTDKDGKELRVTASNTVEVLSDQILYAVWRKVKPRTIMVTYDANGGICRQKNQLFREGDSYDNLPIPVKTGNLFVGWYTERSGGSQVEAKTKAVEGTLYAHWRSLPIKFDECVINLAQSSFIYDGTKKTPAVSVKDGNYSLKNGTDYTVTYINNTNAGTATVTITGKGNYTGTKTATFKINKAVQSITVKTTASSIAVGKTATVSITGNKGTKSYKSSNTGIATVNAKTGVVTAKKVGTVKITATSAATANYNAASKTVTIKVVPASIATATVTCPASKVWAGWALTPVPTVKVGTKTLKKGTDFSLAFRNNKNVGTATITITGKGNYTGTVKKTFKINPKPTSISKLTGGSKKFTATWKKQASQTSGYQIQYSSRKDFKTQKIVTVSGASKTSRTLSGLAKKHKYYMRIRTYKTVGKTKYYSTWSAAKTVTTK